MTIYEKIKTMTRQEIITALAVCANKEHGSCRDCPAWVDAEHSHCEEVLSGALQLLRQQEKEVNDNG